MDEDIQAILRETAARLDGAEQPPSRQGGNGTALHAVSSEKASAIDVLHVVGLFVVVSGPSALLWAVDPAVGVMFVGFLGSIAAIVAVFAKTKELLEGTDIGVILLAASLGAGGGFAWHQTHQRQSDDEPASGAQERITSPTTSITAPTTSISTTTVATTSTPVTTPTAVPDPTTTTGPPATAAPPATHQIRGATYTTLCLTAIGGGSSVQAVTCGGGAEMEWRVTPERQIRGGGGDGCLAVDGPHATGTAVVVQACDGTDDQTWQMPEGDGEITTTDGFCLDIGDLNGARVSGSPVQIWRCEGRPEQRWTLS